MKKAEVIEKLVEQVQGLVSRRKSAAGQIEKGRAMIRELDGSIDSQAQALRGSVSLEELLLTGHGADGLPPEVKGKLGHLQELRGKREVLPGVIARYEEQLREIDVELAAANRSLMIAYRDRAAKDEAVLRSELVREAAERCGGDQIRAREVAEFGISRSELRRWQQMFAAGPYGNDQVLIAEKTLGMVERFEAGKPVRQAKPATAKAEAT
jgi:hypothetical protein